MTTTTAARFAEVYESGTETAVVVHATEHRAQLRKIAHGTVVSSEFTVTRVQLARDWTPAGRLPTLTCVSSVAANRAAGYLAHNGATVVFANGCTVAADLDDAGLRRFVEDVRPYGWIAEAQG